LLEVRIASLYKGLGWCYRSERDLERAWHAVSLAQYEVENLQGVIAFERNEYQDAIERLEKALVLAQRLKHEECIAKTSNNLARIYTMIGRFSEAVKWFEQAEATYRQIWKMTALDGVWLNRAFMHNLAGEYERAVEVVQQLWEENSRYGKEVPPSLALLIKQNLAEALLGQGLLAEAEESVQWVIDQEEIAILPDAQRTYGEIRLRQGRYEEAETLVRSSINLSEQNENPDRYLLGYAYRVLAQILTAKNEMTSASEARMKAVDIFSQINLPNEVDRT